MRKLYIIILFSILAICNNSIYPMRIDSSKAPIPQTGLTFDTKVILDPIPITYILKQGIYKTGVIRQKLPQSMKNISDTASKLGIIRFLYSEYNQDMENTTGLILNDLDIGNHDYIIFNIFGEYYPWHWACNSEEIILDNGKRYYQMIQTKNNTKRFERIYHLRNNELLRWISGYYNYSYVERYNIVYEMDICEQCLVDNYKFLLGAVNYYDDIVTTYGRIYPFSENRYNKYGIYGKRLGKLIKRKMRKIMSMYRSDKNVDKMDVPQLNPEAYFTIGKYIFKFTVFYENNAMERLLSEKILQNTEYSNMPDLLDHIDITNLGQTAFSMVDYNMQDEKTKNKSITYSIVVAKKNSKVGRKLMKDMEMYKYAFVKGKSARSVKTRYNKVLKYYMNNIENITIASMKKQYSKTGRAEIGLWKLDLKDSVELYKKAVESIRCMELDELKKILFSNNRIMTNIAKLTELDRIRTNYKNTYWAKIIKDSNYYDYRYEFEINGENIIKSYDDSAITSLGLGNYKEFLKDLCYSYVYERRERRPFYPPVHYEPPENWYKIYVAKYKFLMVISNVEYDNLEFYDYKAKYTINMCLYRSRKGENRYKIVIYDDIEKYR